MRAPSATQARNKAHDRFPKGLRSDNCRQAYRGHPFLIGFPAAACACVRQVLGVKRVGSKPGQQERCVWPSWEHSPSQHSQALVVHWPFHGWCPNCGLRPRLRRLPRVDAGGHSALRHGACRCTAQAASCAIAAQAHGAHAVSATVAAAVEWCGCACVSEFGAMFWSSFRVICVNLHLASASRNAGFSCLHRLLRGV